ncbi:O-Antigen ligase family protein [Francisella frigiditurris]|uniref:O-Antigen ligase family protein n=2 Tax=Francisella frigiditurris TaxID=1542390 RepID=A0A1J0KSQ3_9GAMM|nr:O-Antigen ligase family protein [Francisella frigiditurris]
MLAIVAIPIATSISVVSLLILFLLSSDYKAKLLVIKEEPVIWALFLLVMISVFSLFYGEGNPKYIFSLIKLLIFFTVILYFIKKYFIAKELLIIFVSSVILLALFSVLNHLFLTKDFFIHFAKEDAYPMASSQNEMAIALVTASILLIVESQKHLGYKKYVYILLSMFLVYCEYFLNQSRTGYLMEFVVILYYCFIFCFPLNSPLNNRKINFKRTFIVILVLIVLPLIIYEKSYTFKFRVDASIKEVKQFFYEKTDIDKNITSSGIRLGWYYASYKTITSSPEKFVFGCGTGYFKDCVQKVINKSPKNQQLKMAAPDQNPHNQFIFFLLQSGMIGLIVFLYFLISIVLQAKQTNYKNTLWMLVTVFCIGCMFNSYMLDLRTGPITFLPIILILATKYKRIN